MSSRSNLEKTPERGAKNTFKKDSGIKSTVLPGGNKVFAEGV